MAEPYIGEIRIFGFTFAPKNWATCDGQLLAIAQNTALFSILGTTFGGDGKTTFALPNFKSRAPMHFGQGKGLTDRVMGEMAGESSHTLILQEMPAHNHGAAGSTSGAPSTAPSNRYWGQVPGQNLYNTAVGTTMNPAALSMVGGGNAHNNMQPYLTLLFCICMSGAFPRRS